MRINLRLIRECIPHRNYGLCYNLGRFDIAPGNTIMPSQLAGIRVSFPFDFPGNYVFKRSIVTSNDDTDRGSLYKRATFDVGRFSHSRHNLSSNDQLRVYN